MGCVPVYIYNESWLPYQDVLDWSEFAVLCHRDELEGLPGKLLAMSGTWDIRAHMRLRDLVPQFFSFSGMCQHLSRMIGGF